MHAENKQDEDKKSAPIARLTDAAIEKIQSMMKRDSKEEHVF